jgi:hypothetical protein
MYALFLPLILLNILLEYPWISFDIAGDAGKYQIKYGIIARHANYMYV